MKKLGCLFFVVLLIPGGIFGEIFDDVVDFNLSLGDLSDPDTAEQALRGQRVVVLEGLVGDSSIDRDSAISRVWVPLVGGEWIGTEEVRGYTCMVAFTGEKWLEVFPVERPDVPNSSYIPPGSRLLIALRIKGYDDVKGRPLGEMVAFRVLD